MEQKQKIQISQTSIIKNAFDAAQIGIWHWCIDSNELIINEAYAKIIGYTCSELAPYNGDLWKSICHPEDQETLIADLNGLPQTSKKHFAFRARLKHKNGSWIWAQVNGGISEYNSDNSPTELSGTLTDISELYQSKNTLDYRLQIEKIVSTISADFIGFQQKDLDKHINKTIKKIGEFLDVDRCYVFQFDNHNSIMSNTHEWCKKGIPSETGNLQNLPTSAFPWWMKKLNKLKHINIKQVKKLPKYAAAEKDILLSQSIVSLLVVPIHYRENLLGFIGFDSISESREWPNADIHLLKTIAHTIANGLNANASQKVLIEAKEKAEESNKIKSAFLATINHELRTPLHHILGFSELMRMNKIPTNEISNFADKIHRSGNHLLQIIEDILNLALADSSFVKVRKESFKGMEMFLQHKTLLEELVRSSNKENQIELIYKPAPNLVNKKFIADNNKINQVIVNLIKNAVKFTRSGQIEYHADISNNTLLLKIKDTGIGIPYHQQRLIFDFFRQGDDNSTRAYSGIGVGLAISKRITNIMDGELSVQSIQGKGSTFTLSIPVEVISLVKAETANELSRQ
ncbi:ATP-binding protein [uncultured Sunxiuqinia sp.]|uniref:ATP-binding protein n=1 Tax=uncultured Sunxiuqinia sp. TaxID=1573825 RepID=UPI002AA67DF0|nr:ATP-binding protein [uncultured Sunxiuqinia sp.]